MNNDKNNSKNEALYFQVMYSRRNWISELFLQIFFAVSSRPRMLLETPIRRNMGERYFNFSSALFLAFVLAVYPILKEKFYLFTRLGGYDVEFSMANFIMHYFTWYIYIAVFVYSAFQRYNEVRHLPGVFDFARFSLSNGYIHPFFRSLIINGERADRRTIETVLEPGLFFLGGLVLWIFGQSIGLLLLICSIFYSLSYISAYQQADHVIMDKIDAAIVNEELGRTIIEGREIEETRGFSFMGRRPADPTLQRQMVAVLTGQDETFALV
ncbi:hypothetical protein M0L20_07810 [Spirosoma sp. RP8]|uniref:ABC transporter ATP-binding protein n=1 Tax=Spirosoma liriopis TaxID=2937440 RepID=A0ABT0HHW7_9BACT|nr:hypothetical protein [Spirosoma liriopis]MCK8491754.1 hypothetical protein [Spirosoma liriopis]